MESYSANFQRDNREGKIRCIGAYNQDVARHGVEFISITEFKNEFNPDYESVKEEFEKSDIIQFVEIISKQEKRRFATLVSGMILCLLVVVAGLIFYKIFGYNISISRNSFEELDSIFTHVSSSQFSYTFGVFIPGLVIALTAGVVGFWFRRKNLLWYGVLEVVFGVILTQLALNVSILSAASFIKAVATVYIVIRGMDNIEKSLTGTKVGKQWADFFGLTLKDVFKLLYTKF